MNLQIALTLGVIGLTLVAYIREWAAPDVIAFSILCLVVALGLAPMDEMTSVFSNEAPITIAALFIIGGALERTGAVDRLGQILKKRLSGNVGYAIFAFSVMAAFFSAWMNNTAIVAILLPITLSFAHSKDIPASKLLIPLSYSSIVGGCCTLIGTSTNLLVSGSLASYQQKPLQMFELAPIGLILTVVVIAYLIFFGAKALPNRASITGSLAIEHRTTQLYHTLVHNGSPLIGMALTEAPIAKKGADFQTLEVRRGGERLMRSLSQITIEENDRILLYTRRSIKQSEGVSGALRDLGLTLLAKVSGVITELIVHGESSLLGATLAQSDFRQNYNSIVIAVHRDGKNITERIANMALEAGDTLLVHTSLSNLPTLRATRDFYMTDEIAEQNKQRQEIKSTQTKGSTRQKTIAWATLVTVVVVATMSDFLGGHFSFIKPIPIHYCAIVGALVLMWLRIITPRESYSCIDWQVLFMLYGLLGLGLAMQKTGTAQWIADSLVSLSHSFVPQHLMPIVLLWACYLVTLALTEVLSNNATAVMMIPIVIPIAQGLGVNPRGFIVAITIASSAAFAMPMGYQTHMMVFGPGGYSFRDFIKVGAPLDLLCWVVACTVIPMIWSF